MSDRDKSKIAEQWKSLNPQQRNAVLGRMTTEQKNQLAGDLGFNQGSTARTVPVGELRPMSEREQLRTVYPVGAKGETARENIQNFLRDVFTGAASVTIDLPRTAKTFVQSLVPGSEVPNPIQSMYEGLRDQPAETIAQAIGQAPTGKLGGKLTGPVTKRLMGAAEKARHIPSKATESFGRTMTGTGVGTTRGLVEEARKANEAEIARVAKSNVKETEAAKAANEKQLAERKAKVQEHGRQTIEAEKERSRIQDAKDRKVAMERGVEHLDPELKDSLEKTYKDAKAAADKPYNEVKAGLKEAEGADPEIMRVIRASALESIRGAKNVPTLLKNFIESEENSFDYLQGVREEIGRELRKGTLDPDVFDAYKKIIWGDKSPRSTNIGITSAMEDIARRADVAEQMETGKNPGFEKKLKDARAGYRQYAETFLDKDSIARKALNSSERGGVVKAYSGKDISGIEALAKYNPELARRINTVRGYASEAKKIQLSKAKPKTVSPLPPRPPELEPKLATPELKTVSADDVIKAKEKEYKGVIEKRRNQATWVVGALPVLYAIRDTMHFRMPDIGTVAVGVPAGVIGTNLVFSLLEKPSVVKFFTKATPKDIAAIPPELMGDFPAIVKAAQAQGIKVNSTVAALASAAAAPKGPVEKRLRQMADQVRNDNAGTPQQ